MNRSTFMFLERNLTRLDLVFCAALALPIISTYFIHLLSVVSISLGLGEIIVPGGTAAFFVNLAGIFGVAWNIVMLRTRSRDIHFVDLLTRCFVIFAIAYHVFFSSLSPVFLIIVFTEVIGALVKYKNRSSFV